MSDIILDTNVAVVANRQNTSVTPTCIDACISYVVKAKLEHVVLLDVADEIRAEYARALQQRRPYELGAQFLFHILQQRFNPRYVRLVDLPKTASGEFRDFPDDGRLRTFDPSDRKFAALARKSGTPVTNATDSDWVDYKAALNTNGIEVNFLCGCNKAAWFKI